MIEHLPNFANIKTCAYPEGGRGFRTPPPPRKNTKNIGVSSNIGPDPMKNRKATKPAFNAGSSSERQRNAIQWRFPGGPMMAKS